VNASRQSLIVSALICIAMLALFVARYRLAPYPVEAAFTGGMPMAAWLTGLTSTQPWVALGVGTALLGWTLLLVVQMTIKFAPAAGRNYLPAQIFLIVWGGIVVSGEALAAMTAAWLLTMAMRQLIFSYHKAQHFGELFHAGFYLGFIPLLYAPAAVIVPAIAYAAVMLYRRGVREAVVTGVGLVLPFAGAEFIHWALATHTLDSWTLATSDNPIYRELWRCLTVQRDVVGLLPERWTVVMGLVLLMALVGILWMAGHKKKGVRKMPYKFMQHTSLVLLFVSLSALVPGSSTTLGALVAVPCALAVPYAFAGRSAGLSTFVYCLILAAVLALDLLPVLGIPVP
jgi:hypothetical protein